MIALLAGAWLAAGAQPFLDAAAGAHDPVDWTHDYVTARARLEAGRGAPPPEGAEANERAARYGAPRVLLLDLPYSIHPPPALVAVLPLATLPWRAAALAWAALSVAALGWLAVSLLSLWRPEQPAAPGQVALLTVGLALWPPALHCLEKGQWSILLAALIAAGTRALEADRPRRAGIYFGIAAALKATPVVILGLLLVRHRRAALAMVATIAVAAGVSLAAGGGRPWIDFFVEAPRAAAAWGSGPSNTASLNGVLARLFAGSQFARPLVIAPGLARLAFYVVAAALLVAAAACLVAARRRDRESGGGAALDPTSAVWLTLPVLLNPLGWTHVLLLLLVPLALLAREGDLRTRLLAGVLLAAFTIPRQTLAAWAGPIPVSPAAGLLLGLHAFAALALFVWLHRVCRGSLSHLGSRRHHVFRR